MYSSNKWTDIRRVRLHSSSLRFGEDNPTLSFGPLRNERTIISRGISTIPLYLNFQIQVSYTLITASSPGCLNTDPVSSPRLEYRASGSLSWSDIEPGKPL